MNTAEMRKRLRDAYPGVKWATKVDNMSDKQIYATYMRMFATKKP